VGKGVAANDRRPQICAAFKLHLSWTARYFAVASIAPAVFSPSSIAPSMKSAIFAFAKPLSFASGSSFRVGWIGPSRCAIASAISAPYFGTTTALALMHERPPLSLIELTITSM
jgi:hypothetical protein